MVSSDVYPNRVENRAFIDSYYTFLAKVVAAIGRTARFSLGSQAKMTPETYAQNLLPSSHFQRSKALPLGKKNSFNMLYRYTWIQVVGCVNIVAFSRVQVLYCMYIYIYISYIIYHILYYLILYYIILYYIISYHIILYYII